MRVALFYTNLESQKGNELEQNAKAALVFHWKSLHRQVRIQGPISPVSDEEADAYYNSRGRESRIGLGLRSNRALWLTAPHWKRPMKKWTVNIRARIFRARRIGRGGASRLYALSFARW